ncbi:MAG: hypothetical protein R2867_08585 [Caldilineaceae bacterium]
MILQNRRLVWAVGLVLSGLMLLIWNLDLLAPYEPWTQILLALLLLVLSVGFFTGYLAGTQARGLQRSGMAENEWWRFIPAWIMVALAVMILLDTLPTPPTELIAALLFLGIAIAFIHIYLLHRTAHWWALLPAGFTLVIVGLILASALTHNILILGALLFSGMGLVFFVIYALSPGRQQWWSLIPGGVLLIFGLLILTAQGEPAGYMRWWPLLLIGAGLAVLWFSDGKVPASTRSTVTAPTQQPAPTKGEHTAQRSSSRPRPH